jgi:hypothetical protein
MTKSTFGAPSRERIGAGHAGLDSCTVRPMTPGKSPPWGYSTGSLVMLASLAVACVRAQGCAPADPRGSRT